ncbi:MAG: hypothetical protein WC346_09645 [Methanogenium sp.]
MKMVKMKEAKSSFIITTVLDHGEYQIIQMTSLSARLNSQNENKEVSGFWLCFVSSGDFESDQRKVF